MRCLHSSSSSADCLRTSVILSRKLCASKYHKGPRWVHIDNFYVKKWNEDKTAPILLNSYCISCYKVENKNNNKNRKRRRRKKVDVEPFRQWIISWTSFPDNTLEILAQNMTADNNRGRKVDSSQLRRIKNRTPYITFNKGKEYKYPDGQNKVTLDFVDRCLIASNSKIMVHDLYDV
jgi:hypothetical protein